MPVVTTDSVDEQAAKRAARNNVASEVGRRIGSEGGFGPHPEIAAQRVVIAGVTRILMVRSRVLEVTLGDVFVMRARLQPRRTSPSPRIQGMEAVDELPNYRIVWRSPVRHVFAPTAVADDLEDLFGREIDRQGRRDAHLTCLGGKLSRGPP